MSDVIDINRYKSYRSAEVICIKCADRWIAVYPEDTLLKDLECPNCGSGAVILTGEDIAD